LIAVMVNCEAMTLVCYCTWRVPGLLWYDCLQYPTGIHLCLFYICCITV